MEVDPDGLEPDGFDGFDGFDGVEGLEPLITLDPLERTEPPEGSEPLLETIKLPELRIDADPELAILLLPPEVISLMT